VRHTERRRAQRGGTTDGPCAGGRPPARRPAAPARARL